VVRAAASQAFDVFAETRRKQNLKEKREMRKTIFTMVAIIGMALISTGFHK